MQSMITDITNHQAEFDCLVAPCKRGHGNHLRLGRDAGATRLAAAFPETLVTRLQMWVEAECADRRRDNVPAYPSVVPWY